MKAGAATLKTTAIVTALIALGSMTTMRVEAHGDVVPPAVDVRTLKALAADVAQPGLGAITVQNSTLVNGPSLPDATSQSGPVAIDVEYPHYNPLPGITQISPSSGRALEMVPVSQIVVTITGNNFLPESKVLWNGAEISTQYVNATTLRFFLSPGDLVDPGSASVKVVNPAPGGGASNVKGFTILEPLIPYRLYLPLARR